MRLEMLKKSILGLVISVGAFSAQADSVTGEVLALRACQDSGNNQGYAYVKIKKPDSTAQLIMFQLHDVPTSQEVARSAMYSTLLAAHFANKPVTVTYADRPSVTARCGIAATVLGSDVDVGESF